MNFHYAIDPRLVLLPFHWCLKFINHLRYTWLNGRLTTRATVDVFINLLLVLLWIILSKVVLWIPNLIRPPIYVRLCMRLDEYVFSMHPYWMGSILSLICICAGGWLIYNKFYRLISVVLPNAIELTKIGHLTDVSSTSSSEMEHEIGFKLWMDEPFSKHEFVRSYKYAPLILCFSSWFLLNLVYRFHKNYNIVKGIIAWAFYVVLHFLVPIVTSLWLYLFQPQGATALFWWNLGLQNLMALITHFIFPNAPPLYIRVYGDNKPPSYDMKFTDGISRSDMKIGPHIHKAVYWATPSKFGALPSLHSATAVTAFLFACYYSRYNTIKALAFLYIILQWWAAVYSEHHWRVDLLTGMFYSLGTFTFFHSYTGSFQKLDQQFIKSRQKGDLRAGTTAGMRLFANSRFSNWFDPLS